MTLKEYLKRPGVTLDGLAAETGLSSASLSRISNGLQKPSHDAMRVIAVASGGLVEPNDFFGIAA